jgi:hypothetical protein
MDRTANAKEALALIKNDPAAAIEIAEGGKNKTGIKTSLIIGGLALQAKENKNFLEMERYLELLRIHNLDVGQEAAANAELIKENTIFEWYGMLKQRLTESKFKPKRTILRNISKSAAKVAQEKVDMNVKSAEKAVSKGQLKVNNLLAHLEKLRCK